MKKLISFFLVALFLLGSFPATFAEEVHVHEDGHVHMEDDEILPMAECNHDDYRPFMQDPVWKYLNIGSCDAKRYIRNICPNCNAVVSLVPHVPEIIEPVHRGTSELRFAGIDGNGNPYYQYFCTYCDQVW